MKNKLTVLLGFVCAAVIAVSCSAATKSGHDSIEIYTPHSAPTDMTMMKQAFKRGHFAPVLLRRLNNT